MSRALGIVPLAILAALVCTTPFTLPAAERGLADAARDTWPGAALRVRMDSEHFGGIGADKILMAARIAARPPLAGDAKDGLDPAYCRRVLDETGPWLREGTVFASFLRKGRVVCFDTLGDRAGAMAEARIYADQAVGFVPAGSTWDYAAERVPRSRAEAYLVLAAFAADDDHEDLALALLRDGGAIAAAGGTPTPLQAGWMKRRKTLCRRDARTPKLFALFCAASGPTTQGRRRPTTRG